MTAYRDRGNLKWIPFLMPEHLQLLREYYIQMHQLDLPEIDEQLQESWHFLLQEALIEGNELEITYYKESSYVTVVGFVERLEPERSVLFLRSREILEIPFTRIVRIENG